MPQSAWTLLSFSALALMLLPGSAQVLADNPARHLGHDTVNPPPRESLTTPPVVAVSVAQSDGLAVNFAGGAAPLKERLARLRIQLKPGPDGLTEAVDGMTLGELEQDVARERGNGAASFEMLRDLALIFWWSQKDAKAQEWALEAYDAALGANGTSQQVEARLLCEVAEMMNAVGLTKAKTRDYSEFATVLVRLAETGSFFPSAHCAPVLAGMLWS